VTQLETFVGASRPLARSVRRLAAREREVRDTLWLLLAIVWVLIPFAVSLPLWSTLAMVALLAWRTHLTLGGRRLPPRWLVLGLMLAAGIGVYLQYHSIFGKDAGVDYIVLLLGLKLLELKARRDTFVVIFLCSFIMLTSLFDSQSLGTALWLFAGVLWLVTALVRMNLLGGEPSLRAKLKLALQMTLLALPLTAAIFVFFPRVEGPLWGMPADAYARSAGLSDTMSPGSFEKLVQSDALAFTVRFADRMPPPSERYWRGPVLGAFDGTTWRALLNPNALDPATLEGEPQSLIHYSISLEETNRNALYLLDAPAAAPDVRGHSSLIKSDLEVLVTIPIRQRVHFEADSYTHFHYGLALGPEDRRAWLSVPTGLNPRTREFAEQLRAEAPNDRALVTRALNFIRTQNFVYSTNAPLLGRNGVDQFLFETRRGFCEHYASAFTVLMRFAGIPARVVTGYLGGSINPVNGDISVRQKDAHAWSEVWLPESGWTRVDPTAAVAPGRILDSDDTLGTDSGLAGAFRGIGADSLRWLRNHAEAINTFWNQWIVAYSDDTQKSLFSHLGMPNVDWGALTIALIASCALIVAFLGGQVILRRPRPEPVVALYLRLCEVIGRRSAPRRPSEGPRDYFARIESALREPERTRAREAFLLYEQLRYTQDPPTAERLSALRACIRSLGARARDARSA
jgi:transglutaminase-like putative cysteine protease